jgi:hypothetical protein
LTSRIEEVPRYSRVVTRTSATSLCFPLSLVLYCWKTWKASAECLRVAHEVKASVPRRVACER